MSYKNINFPKDIYIGTRASDLAIKQSEEVKKNIIEAFPDNFNFSNIHIVKIETTGDKIQDKSLLEIGGKGLFTKEIEDALFKKEIDIAVHSMKDMPHTLPPGLIISSILNREDPRDAFISRKVTKFLDLPIGSIVGTSSIRRQTQSLNIRPDLKIVPFRGNVNTRISKLSRGDVDATFLAVAGLKRINLEKEISSILEIEEMLPAIAQGAIGIECLKGNENIINITKFINHKKSELCVNIERIFLQELGGSCSSPIAGFAEFTKEEEICFKAMILNPKDPQEAYKITKVTTISESKKAAIEAAKEILKLASHLL